MASKGNEFAQLVTALRGCGLTVPDSVETMRELIISIESSPQFEGESSGDDDDFDDGTGDNDTATAADYDAPVTMSTLDGPAMTRSERKCLEEQAALAKKYSVK